MRQPANGPEAAGAARTGTPLGTDRPIRWGITTTGNMASVFTRELRLLPDDAEVVAVASRDATRAREFAARLDIPRSHGSYAALARDPDVDVVYVATPHPSHVTVARDCLLAGKAVLCEKPLTVNAAQAAELVALARSRGVFLMEAMWMRCNPIMRRLRELVRDGAVGTVSSVAADMGILAPPDPAGRLRAPELAGGALLDVGIYPVTFACQLLGPPATVRAHAHLTPTGVDGTTGILLGYDDGAVAALTCSIDAPQPGLAWVAGTGGRIEIGPSFHDRASLTRHHPGAEPITESVELLGVGYTYEAQEVARCLRSGRCESPLVSWEDSLVVLRVLDEVRRQVGLRYPME